MDVQNSNPPPDSGPWQCSNAEYHGESTRVSHSSLELFAESVVAYRDKYVLKTAPPSEATPAMELGTLTHSMILEPESVAAEFTLSPKFDRRTKIGKAEAEAWEAENVGKIVVDPDMWAKATGMATAVLGNPTARGLLSLPGENEFTICWNHAASGVACKTRMDGFRKAANIILDVKSAANPLPEFWHKHAYNLGYYRQSPFYKMAVNATYGTDIEKLKFIFIVVGSSWPHEVVVYELDSAFEDLGFRETNSQLLELAERRKTGEWTGRHSEGINSLSGPRWAFSNNSPINGKPSLAGPKEMAVMTPTSRGLIAKA